ncbi:LacI family DNA-binding transcriptional regulator [Aestuariimicrobium ganziense]|uniref:LacI family DNA-binding transcriptional regulator n=1 Tax=Aestuariimicrobium ganziense TaxID=2773677 RepID=UPI001A9B698C|nr:LacI family DNA-binding transcriptional regulator [Aestuariimicrobium ganziense]
MSITPLSRRRRGGPSIQDVARLAGVSAQTVSRVSTGAGQVRPATRARVEHAMEQLGYTPNKAARALRSGSFGAIGLLAHRFERTGETLTMGGVIDAAERAGYSVSLLNVRTSNTESWASAVSRLSHQAIDGLAIIRAERTAPENLALPAGLPVAVSDSRLVGHLPAVVTDQMGGARRAVEHLLGLGHHSVHHISGPEDSDPASMRVIAWQETLVQAGIRPPKAWQGDWTPASGYEIGLQIARDPNITAVFCANDEMAFGLMRALHELGRRVPDDISIVGFDGIALTEYSAPPLTTVKQDFHRIGDELVAMLLARMQSPQQPPPRRVLIPTELTVRVSTAPPPPR